MPARERQGHHQWRHKTNQGRCTPEVEVAPGCLAAGIGHRDCHEQDRDYSHRNVHVENPSPAHVVGQQAAGGGAKDRGHAEDAPEQPLNLASLLRWVEVGYHAKDRAENEAGEETLESSEDDQLGHRPGEAAQRRPAQESDHGDQKHRLAAKEVTELACDGRHAR